MKKTIELIAEIKDLEQKLKKFTKTEKIIFECIKEGMKRKEIAEKLFKSEETVKIQIRSLRKKL
ncbi:hypothetical protein COK06_23630 [Bacillus cereus]|uniref:helix-turn-helix transcriptional regulator n=1 Tax=Bacillus nitratireducens TaxID=2026193 RepID=UPI000BEBC4D8|nr:LuxR C-terminal-related transcriptional regulator [Bacillus nitratireducens]PEA18366.1 hypothetical protein CON40_24880 [Bacillus cereus]HDR7630893.1 DNA-binding response regulator [Bacillus mycoides]PET94267.1 hypothetical protein CN527_27705 [Bacillus cereus]PEV95967.1 hypothetical protein CN428_28160 [Bacillus cereus]PFA25697.1 hypothetical protein CN390_29035 [Bacillus cereus]